MSNIKEDINNAVEMLDELKHIDTSAPGVTNFYVHPSIAPKLREFMEDDPTVKINTIITADMVIEDEKFPDDGFYCSST